jgi:hypothetical protein
MSKAVKIKIYKTMMKLVMYGSETWALTEMDMKRQYMREKNI